MADQRNDEQREIDRLMRELDKADRANLPSLPPIQPVIGVPGVIGAPPGPPIDGAPLPAGLQAADGDDMIGRSRSPFSNAEIVEHSGAAPQDSIRAMIQSIHDAVIAIRDRLENV